MVPQIDQPSGIIFNAPNSGRASQQDFENKKRSVGSV